MKTADFPRLYRCPESGSLSLRRKRGYELLYNDDILDGFVEIHQFETREEMLEYQHKFGDDNPGLLHCDVSINDGKPALILTWAYGSKLNREPITVKQHYKRHNVAGKSV